MKRLTIEGAAAQSLADSIKEARIKCPVLEGISDEKVISILLDYAFAIQGREVPA